MMMMMWVGQVLLLHFPTQILSCKHVSVTFMTPYNAFKEKLKMSHTGTHDLKMISSCVYAGVILFAE